MASPVFYGALPTSPASVNAMPSISILSNPVLDEDSIIVLVNGILMTPMITNIDLENWNLQIDIPLYYGLEYLIKVEASNADGTSKTAFSFTVEEGVFFRDGYENEYYRSVWTQNTANELAPFTYARKCENSVFQTFINPTALNLEKKSKEIQIHGENLFLPTAHLDSLNKLHTYQLSYDETAVTYSQLGDGQFVLPSVTGYSNGSKISVRNASGNLLENLFYLSLPTRISGELTASGYFETILAATISTDFPQTEFPDFALPSYLYVETIGGVQYRGDSGPVEIYFTVTIEGKDRVGAEQSEQLVFSRDQILKTSKTWSEITRITTSGDFNECLVAVYRVPPRGAPFFDPYIRFISNDLNNELFWRLNSGILEECALSTTDILEILREIPAETVQRHYELADINGNYISAEDLTADHTWLYAVDHEKLYVFSKLRKWPVETKTLLQSGDIDYELTAYGDQLTYIRNDAIQLEVEHVKATRIPLAYTLDVRKPDGSTERLSFGRNESSRSYVYRFPTLEYTLTSSGVYIFTLEIAYTNDTVDKTQVLIEVVPRQAVAEYSLKSVWGEPELLQKRVLFGDDGHLYIINGTDMYRVDFKYDYMIYDYTSKVLYFREEYEHVEVDSDGL